MDPVSLVFRYEEQDYVRALRAHYAMRLRLPLDITVILLCAGAGFYFRQSPEWRGFGTGLIGLSAAFALMLITAFGVLPRVLFRQEAKFRDEYSLTFSADAIHFRTDHVDAQIEWKIYSSALIDSHSFVLYYGVRSFTVIPKRAFLKSGEQKIFEELIIEKIPKIVRKG